MQTWIVRRIAIRHRLERVCTSARLFLLVVTTPQALAEAARFSGLHTAPFSQRLQAPRQGAVAPLERLAKQPATPVSQARPQGKERPWPLAMVVESPLHHRARLPPANAQTFHHGHGGVVGHPWPTLVLRLHAMLMPLRPIPFSRQRAGRAPALAYRPAPALVVEDIPPGNLDDARGAAAPREVVVFTDSGSDNTQLQPAIADKPWQGRLALAPPRRVQAARLALTTPKAPQGCHSAPVFRPPRRRTWHPMRITTHGPKRQRMACRTRDTLGYRRSVGQGPLVCSAPRQRPEGRRKSFACHALRGTARQIRRGYRLRGALALWQKTVQQPLGFEDGATSGLDSVLSQGHWGEGADRVLAMSPPGGAAGVTRLRDPQRQLPQLLANQAPRRVLQQLTQIGGGQREKDALRQALAGAGFLGSLPVGGLEGLHGFVGATCKV